MQERHRQRVEVVRGRGKESWKDPAEHISDSRRFAYKRDLSAGSTTNTCRSHKLTFRAEGSDDVLDDKTVAWQI